MYNGDMVKFKGAPWKKIPNRVFDGLAVILILLYSFVYWISIPSVPFHPDESTQIFMSADWVTLFSHPVELAWQDNQPVTLAMHYRLVDPPLTHWFIGAFRAAAQQPALEDDWNWSLNWEDNIAAGALPGDDLLLVSRIACTWCIPITLWAAYKSGKKIQGRTTGSIALILMMTNALVLLHTRRAMAESLLLCFCMLTIWCMLSRTDKPWLAVLPAALAFNAKYSALGLVILGFGLCFLTPYVKNVRSKIINAGLYAFLLIAVFFALNPVYWQQPVQALLASVQERQALSQDQVSMLSTAIPHLAPSSIWLRGVIGLANLFIAPPAPLDVGNYSTNLSEQISFYFSNPLTSFSQQLVPSALIIILITIGCLGLLRQLSTGNTQTKLNAVILLIGAILSFIVLVLLLPITFQRYVIPLVPFSVLFSAVGAAQIINIFQRRVIGSNEKLASSPEQ